MELCVQYFRVFMKKTAVTDLPAVKRQSYIQDFFSLEVWARSQQPLAHETAAASVPAPVSSPKGEESVPKVASIHLVPYNLL